MNIEILKLVNGNYVVKAGDVYLSTGGSYTWTKPSQVAEYCMCHNIRQAKKLIGTHPLTMMENTEMVAHNKEK